LLTCVEAVKAAHIEGDVEAVLDVVQASHVSHSKLRLAFVPGHAGARLADCDRGKVHGDYPMPRTDNIAREAAHTTSEFEHAKRRRGSNELHDLRRDANVTPNREERTVGSIKVGTGCGWGVISYAQT